MNALVVDDGGCDHKNVKQLMRMKPDVKFAGKESFRYARSVQGSAGDVQSGHAKDAEQTESKIGHGEPILGQHPVHAGEDAGQGKRKENTGTQWTIFGYAETITQWNHDGGHAQRPDEQCVDHLGNPVVTIEAVVDAGKKGAGDQQSDSTIVESTEQFTDAGRMTAEHVICGRKAKTDDSTGKVSTEYELVDCGQMSGQQGASSKSDEDHTADHMSPNVARFRVQTETRPKASVERAQLWPVAEMKIIVVLQPLRQFSKMAHVPGVDQRLSHDTFGLFCLWIGAFHQPIDSFASQRLQRFATALQHVQKRFFRMFFQSKTLAQTFDRLHHTWPANSLHGRFTVDDVVVERRCGCAVGAGAGRACGGLGFHFEWQCVGVTYEQRNLISASLSGWLGYVGGGWLPRCARMIQRIIGVLFSIRGYQNDDFLSERRRSQDERKVTQQ